MTIMQISLPRMNNRQFDYVEDQARRRHISLQECPTCGSVQEDIYESSGLYDWPKDATYSLFGETFSCDCANQVELLRHYLLADIPKGYWRLGEDAYWGDEDALAKVNAYISNWEKYKRHGYGLQIFSPHKGVGKTLLSTMIARRLIQSGEYVVFTSFRDMVQLYRVPESERIFRMDRLRDTPVLIIDEVTKGMSEAQSNFMGAELEDTIRFRTSGNTVTIVTTNMTESEMDEEYPGCFSLLSGSQILVEVNGDDVRKNGDKQLVELELIANGEVRPLC